MEIKGTKQEIKGDYSKKFTGFASFEVVAVNPTRAEQNELLGIENKDSDKEKVYRDTDKEGHDRTTLEFWLFNEKNNKYFTHKIWISNAIGKAANGKTLFANSACDTYYATDADALPDYFSKFLSKQGEVLGNKIVREAYIGEDQLLVFIKAWLGRLNFWKADTEVIINTKKIAEGDYSELKSLVKNAYTAPFVALIGVETDQNDPTKQHQKVFGKAFLPNNFMEFIENPALLEKNTYAKEKIWAKFQSEVTKPDHGFKAHYKSAPLSEYDPKEDLTQSNTTKTVTPVNSKY